MCVDPVFPKLIRTYLCSAECPNCVAGQSGLTCCGKGGSWDGKCGPPGDDNFDYTWGEGLKACVTKALEKRLEAEDVIVHTRQDDPIIVFISGGALTTMKTAAAVPLSFVLCVLLLPVPHRVL